VRRELGKQNSTYTKVLGAQDAEAATPSDPLPKNIVGGGAKQRANSM